MNKIKYIIIIFAVTVIVAGTIILLLPREGIFKETKQDISYAEAFDMAYNLYNDDEHDVTIVIEDDYYKINVINSETKEIERTFEINKQEATIDDDTSIDGNEVSVGQSS